MPPSTVQELDELILGQKSRPDKFVPIRTVNDLDRAILGQKQSSPSYLADILTQAPTGLAQGLINIPVGLGMLATQGLQAVTPTDWWVEGERTPEERARVFEDIYQATRLPEARTEPGRQVRGIAEFLAPAVVPGGKVATTLGAGARATRLATKAPKIARATEKVLGGAGAWTTASLLKNLPALEAGKITPEEYWQEGGVSAVTGGTMGGAGLLSTPLRRVAGELGALTFVPPAVAEQRFPTLQEAVYATVTLGGFKGLQVGMNYLATRRGVSEAQIKEELKAKLETEKARVVAEQRQREEMKVRQRAGEPAFVGDIPVTGAVRKGSQIPTMKEIIQNELMKGYINEKVRAKPPISPPEAKVPVEEMEARPRVGRPVSITDIPSKPLPEGKEIPSAKTQGPQGQEVLKPVEAQAVEPIIPIQPEIPPAIVEPIKVEKGITPTGIPSTIIAKMNLDMDISEKKWSNRPISESKESLQRNMDALEDEAIAKRGEPNVLPEDPNYNKYIETYGKLVTLETKDLSQSQQALIAKLNTIGVKPDKAEELLSDIYSIDPKSSIGIHQASQYTLKYVADRTRTRERIENFLWNQPNKSGGTLRDTYEMGPLTDKGRGDLSNLIKTQTNQIEELVYRTFEPSLTKTPPPPSALGTKPQPGTTELPGATPKVEPKGYGATALPQGEGVTPKPLSEAETPAEKSQRDLQDFIERQGEMGAEGIFSSRESTKIERGYEEVHKYKEAQRKGVLGRAYADLKRNIVDESGNLKKKLYGLGPSGREVVVHHDLIAGAGTKAGRDVELAVDKIYTGLSKTETEYLNRFITSTRVATIAKYRPDIKHPMGSVGEHQGWLADFEKLPFKDKLKEKATAYFAEMRNQLDQLKKEGLITQEEHVWLSEKGPYSPREYLHKLDPAQTHTIGGRTITVGDSGLKPLEAGSEKLVETDTRQLLAQVISRTQNRIFRNNASKALYALAKENPDNGIVGLAKMVGKTEAGRPVYETAQPGYYKVKAMIEGQPKEMIMPSEMALEWLLRDPILTTGQASVARWGSGSPILKAMATGVNPEFALTNFPRDIVHTWLADYMRVWSPHLPVFAGQMTRNLGKVFMDTIKRTGRWDAYINEGGGMEFLTHQGRIVHPGIGIAGKLQNLFGYLGETSEILVRLSIREQALSRGMTPKQATWYARNYIDFSQGGRFIKAVDNAVPYLNASVQGTRGLFRAGAIDPGVFMYRVGQLGALSMGLYYANYHNNPEAYKDVPDYEKVNNFILTTPFTYTDRDGNKRYFYIRIAKDQGQRFLASFFEQAAKKMLGQEVNPDEVAEGFKQMIPIMPTESLPPVMDALIGYITNKDFWRNEDIWKGPEIEPKEEFTARTHPAFRELGKITGGSPERLKYALSQYFTGNNIYTSLTGYALSQLMGEMSEEQRRELTEEMVLRKPFVRKLLQSTKPEFQERKELKEAKLEGTTEQYKITRNFKTISQRFYDGAATKEELRTFLRSVPPQERSRLIQDHKVRGKLQDLPKREWWIDLRNINPPEVRASAYLNRWLGASQEERQELDRNLRRVPGVRSERFNKRLLILKRKEKGSLIPQ